MKLKTLATTLAVAAGLACSFSASASRITFTVDEAFAADPSTSGTLVQADKINGGFVERLNFDGDGNFDAKAFATFGQFFLGSNSLNTGLNNQYSLYAVFEASGTSGQDGAIDFFIGDQGGFTLYLDRNNDTELSDDNDVDSVVNISDDVELGFSMGLGDNLATSTTIMGQNITAFKFDFMDFQLTGDGDNYFVAPNPFAFSLEVGGDFDAFSPAGTQIIRGDVSAEFMAVPEPSTIAVMGLGLLGLGAVRRRKA